VKYSIFGGDERFAILKRLLSDAGYEECGAEPQLAIVPIPTPKGCVSLFEGLPKGTLVLAGKCDADMKNAANEKGLRLFDYTAMPSFAAKNADITAEGAVYLLMRSTDSTLKGKRALVIGFGRIGKLLARKLAALGVRVSVLSSSADMRALAEALGYGSEKTGNCGGDYDMLINTAPAALLSAEELRRFKRGTLVLELASAPGGFTEHELRAMELRYIAAPGLPGRYAPYSAAEVIFDAVKSILKEQENGN